LPDNAEAFAVESYAAADGVELRVRHWRVGEPKGVIVCLHGIQSHGGWYLASSAHFAARGYEVFFLDRRGSGISGGQRGDTASFRVLFDDIDRFFDYANLDPNLPVHLAGISWGGKLACCYVAASSRKPASLALICPGIMPRTRLPFGRMLHIAAARLACPGQLFEIPLSDPWLFTQDPEKAGFIAADPLKNTHATARFMVESARLDRYLARHARELATPTLLVMAGRDRICDNARLARFLERIPAARKKALTYPEASHTIEFEPDPTPYFDDWVAWFDECSARGAPA